MAVEAIHDQLAGPNRLSNRCFIGESLTSMAGKRSFPVALEGPETGRSRGRLLRRPEDTAAVGKRRVGEHDQVRAVVDEDAGARPTGPTRIPSRYSETDSPLRARTVQAFVDQRRHGIVVGRERVSRGEVGRRPRRGDRQDQGRGLRLHVEGGQARRSGR